MNRASRSWRRPTTARPCCGRHASTVPTSSSPTSGCRRRRATRACAPASRSGRSFPGPPSWSCPSTPSAATPRSCWPTARPAGVGYLLKQRIGRVDAFCDDVRRVCAGGTVLDPELVGSLLERARPDDDPLHGLTARQRDVLGLMAEGRSNAAIAERLVITEKAVVKHVSRIYEQLELPLDADDHRRVLAVLRYLSPPDDRG